MVQLGIQCKNTFGCMVGLTVTVVCVVSSDRTVRGVSERRPAVN